MQFVGLRAHVKFVGPRAHVQFVGPRAQGNQGRGKRPVDKQYNPREYLENTDQILENTEILRCSALFSFFILAVYWRLTSTVLCCTV